MIPARLACVHAALRAFLFFEIVSTKKIKIRKKIFSFFE